MLESLWSSYHPQWHQSLHRLLFPLWSNTAECFCPLTSRPSSVSWTSMSPHHSCVLYSACTNSSRMIIVFDFYSIIDTHVNTVHLQLNTCHLLSLVWIHCKETTGLGQLMAFFPLHYYHFCTNINIWVTVIGHHTNRGLRRPGLLFVNEVFPVKLFSLLLLEL